MTSTSVRQSPPSHLSSAERAIWIGQLLHPTDPLYNMVLLTTIDGDFCADRFTDALESVVNRSDSLRTIFGESDGVPCRKILESIQPVLEHRNFCAKPNPEEFARQWCQSRATEQFNLSEKLFDCVLIQISADRHLWFINNHHLIADASSMANIVKEVGLAYARRLNDQSPDAEPPLPQYADFLRHQSETEKTSQFQHAARYWQEQHNALEPDSLPAIEFFGPRPKSITTASKRFERHLSSEQSRKLRELAQSAEVRALTPDMTVHNIFIATLSALLHRLSGRSELVIGTPAANRLTKPQKETIGLFVELHPLIMKIDEDECFLTLLKKTREQTNGVLMNAQPGTGQSDSLRAFNVVLNYINAKISFSDFTTTTQWLHPESGDSNHHIRLEIHDFDRSGEPVLLFDLNQDVFDEQTSNWLITHFFKTLDTLLDKPQSRLAHMELVEQPELSGPGASPPAQASNDSTIVSVFRDKVEANPNGVALVTDTQRLSYHELSELANTLANSLTNRHQIGQGDIIAIASNRDAETIIAILATLVAGAAYLPIDPAYPNQRISLIIDDARPRLILGPVDKHVHLASFGIPYQPISIEGLQTTPDRETTGLSIGSTDLAYVLYTSGTTGTPNGALVEHRNVLNLSASLLQNVYPHPEQTLNVALVAPLVFDASVQQIFSALLGGHCLHIVPEHVRLNGGLLREFYAHRAIDISDGTPAHLGLISDTGKQVDLPLPQRFVLGGDRMNRTQLADFYANVQPQRPDIVNLYGVAECTVDSTAYLLDPEKLSELPDFIPIGKPLPGSEIIIVSAGGKRQPTGVAGQILIAGSGVSRGYLNRAELTEAKFIAHPYRPYERAYLTGDQGRVDSDGNIHFLGRLDGQIKSRGIRIEPGEIEHHLLTYQSAANSVINIESSLRSHSPDTPRCKLCLLTTAHPEVKLNSDGICNVCDEWSQYAQASHAYFQSVEDFQKLRVTAASGRETPEYDCMLLYSGGKDSSYVLHRLVELGLKVLAFTFDNGFISNAAFENIRRQTSALGVDSIVERASAMDEIFIQSLLTDATVCSGCFRALTAISTRLAHEKKINLVVTGLSRGQIFDTKLAGLYKQGIVNVKQVEENLQLFRKIFHANDDRTAQLLAVDLSLVDTDQIHFVDFFRYDDIGVSGVKNYLRAKDDYWSQPQDTGFCSSNCVMNDVGICVHNSQKGFHNYEGPLSWDVRLGVSLREEVLPEVTSPINLKSSEKILQRIGFYSKKIQGARVLGRAAEDATDHLTAYFQATQEITPEELRTYLTQRLPGYLVPSRFIQTTQMPLTAHGKIDDRALHKIGLNTEHAGRTQAPSTALEEQLVQIWAQVLGLETVGVNDNFFDLGGDSISAIQIVGRANTIGLSLEAPQLLEKQTIAKLASGNLTRSSAPQEAVSGRVPLTPVLNWFLSGSDPAAVQSFSQLVSVAVPARLDPLILTKALGVIIDHHDALRLGFTRGNNQWQATNQRELTTYPTVAVIESSDQQEGQREQIISAMAGRLNVTEPRMIQATILAEPHSCELLIVANHLVVDAVSWTILLEDLELAYRQLGADQTPCLPRKTHSFQAWANALTTYATKNTFDKEARFWRGQENPALAANPLPASSETPNSQAHATQLITSLAESETASLLRVASLSKRPVQELLLAALGFAIAKEDNQENVRIDVEGHGREPFRGAPDVSRTVGWFTSVYPLSLTLAEVDSSSALSYPDWRNFNTVSDQIRAVPDNGFSFGLLHHLTPDNGQATSPDAPVLFNFLGQTRSGLAVSGTDWPGHRLGLFRSPDMLRRHPLEVAASINAGSLSVEWTFTAGPVQIAAIESLAACLNTVLRRIVTLLDDSAGKRSAADFPQAKLTTKGMDKLAAALGKADARNSERGAD